MNILDLLRNSTTVNYVHFVLFAWCITNIITMVYMPQFVPFISPIQYCTTNNKNESIKEVNLYKISFFYGRKIPSELYK